MIPCGWQLAKNITFEWELSEIVERTQEKAQKMCSKKRLRKRRKGERWKEKVCEKKGKRPSFFFLWDL